MHTSWSSWVWPCFLLLSLHLFFFIIICINCKYSKFWLPCPSVLLGVTPRVYQLQCCNPLRTYLRVKSFKPHRNSMRGVTKKTPYKTWYVVLVTMMLCFAVNVKSFQTWRSLMTPFGWCSDLKKGKEKSQFSHCVDVEKAGDCFNPFPSWSRVPTSADVRWKWKQAMMD